MKITLIGAGNLATCLGKALMDAGHEVVEVYSRTMASAEFLAKKLKTRATNDLHQVNTCSDVYILVVKDSALESVIAAFSEHIRGYGSTAYDSCGEQPHSFGGGGGGFSPVILHTAGSVPMDVFKGRCNHYGVLYPLQTFSKDKEIEFREIPIFIEGNDAEALQVSRTLAESVSQSVFDCTSEQRKYLHLAAVFACNFANHCYALSARLLERQGIPCDVLLPLIDETARKVHTLPPKNAQTGPAIRYDKNIIQAQTELLCDFPDLLELYLKLSQSIHLMHNS